MSVEQLSVFVENSPGRLYGITEILGTEGINIIGFSVADMAEYGIFRLVVSDTEAAKTALKAADFTVSESELICVDVPNKPGGLAAILKIFSDGSINVEYMYAIVGTLIVFSVDDPGKAAQALKKEDIRVLERAEVGKL